MVIERPDIPEPMKREIRQRCGFGCVICGNPLYQYHHMNEWRLAQEHKANDITLLCNMHHAEVTNGLLSPMDVENANKRPINIVNRQSTPYLLHFTGGDNIKAIVGDTTFQTNWKTEHLFSAILVDMVTLVGFYLENDEMLVELHLFDEENYPVLDIHNNELVYNVTNWDVEFVGKTLTVRQATRDIILEIEFCVPDTIIVHRGRLYRNGVRIDIMQDSLIIQNNDIGYHGCTIISQDAGISIGEKLKMIRTAIVIEDVKRYEYNLTEK
jgi:hypothetical protein